MWYIFIPQAFQAASKCVLEQVDQKQVHDNCECSFRQCPLYQAKKKPTTFQRQIQPLEDCRMFNVRQWTLFEISATSLTVTRNYSSML